MSLRFQVSQNFTNIKLRILVNKNTFSAAEIVAGVLQHYENVLVIGQETGGKRLHQDSYNLSNGGNIVLTKRRWYLPNEPNIPKYWAMEPIAKLGARVIPDILVASTNVKGSIDKYVKNALDSFKK